MPKPLRKSLFALFLMAATLPALAATPAATGLSGEVLNAKGVPVAFAQVYWESADGTRPHTMKADSKGHFRIVPVRAGLYELRAEANGMWSDWEHNVLVRAGAEKMVTLHLVRETPPTASKTPLRNGVQ